MPELYVVGAGGHAKVVADAAALVGRWRTITLLDRCSAPYQVGPWPVLPEERVSQREGGHHGDFIVGVGDNALRLRLHQRFVALGLRAVTVVHPAATVSPWARLGAGSFVAARAVVQVDALVGEAVVVNTAAVVEHDCQLADGVQIAPGAVLGGGVEVGARSLVGMHAVVKMVVRIGADVTVGMGAVVLHGVGDGARVVGVPARLLG
ncbi:pilin glycosylation protein PglB [Magnetococcus marinus MC-1]|uniref:Pilin glycosylation protein PglB n=1 Tax=Magnetococcus marinus (strain ATCC BAA-1437 / JCM 17883 / MC-1) TaxID=156889 RepID=A0LA17_MAGMM|nr:acetyltransferase [Magnetococcus marinus]ABK44810.1 pilin glycosylation protein PglB [Magnetococcus marinus MC-1]